MSVFGSIKLNVSVGGSHVVEGLSVEQWSAASA